MQSDSGAVNLDGVAVDHRRLAGHVGEGDGRKQGDQDGEGAEESLTPPFHGRVLKPPQISPDRSNSAAPSYVTVIIQVLFIFYGSFASI